MSDSLEQLQQQRTQIFRQIGQLGDLRPGSITNTSGRCGKPSCRCHRPSQPGHGPHTRLTYKAGPKTVTESLPTPAAVGKAEREVAQFRKFQQLSREFVETQYPHLQTAAAAGGSADPPRTKNGLHFHVAHPFKGLQWVLPRLEPRERNTHAKNAESLPCLPISHSHPDLSDRPWQRRGWRWRGVLASR